MAEWRIGRGWSEAELEKRLDGLKSLQRNFSDPIDQMTPERGWHRYASEAVIARTSGGAPPAQGPFARGQTAVANYAFSDPRIVVAHFAPDTPLLGRYMLLELRALRMLHFLGGVVVGSVRSERTEEKTVFGFRYDTLEGHIEAGTEWFLLSQEHDTGAIRFRIEATWRPGQFPNWWSRLGFSVLGRYHQEIWHRRAHRIMARLVRDPAQHPSGSTRGRLVHTDPYVTFNRFEARNG